MKVSFLQTGYVSHAYNSVKKLRNSDTNLLDYSKKSSSVLKNPQDVCVSSPIVSFNGVYSKNVLLDDAEKDYLLYKVKKAKREKVEPQTGSMGVVYKLSLPSRNYPIAVKEFNDENKYRNAIIEANALRKLPKDCNRVQRFLGVMQDGSKKYIASTYQEGEPLSMYKENMSDELISNILDELFKIDRGGVVYYDYGMSNIVTDGREPRFFDFEVVKEQSLTANNHDIEGDLCHQTRNPYFLKITNLGAFEIRTIGKIIGESEKYLDGDEISTNFVARYLKQLSKFYEKTSKLYQESMENPYSEMGVNAVEYERNLAELFRNPDFRVVEIEKQSMRIKELLTEYHFRNDPDLKHDDELYQNIPAFVKNMRERFNKIQSDIADLAYNTNDDKIREYCKVNSDFMRKLEISQLDNYLARKC